jgi:transketolase
MNAIMNGLALHGGYVPFGGTFLMFADYGRSAIRMSALMKLRCMFVFTHDSIGVGGDGPDPPADRACRQPADHSRSVGVADLRHHGNRGGLESGAGADQRPDRLIFTRQKLPHQDRTPEQVRAIARGGYVLLDCGDDPEAIIIATGSEVQLAVDAARQLNAQGRRVRVVSMPSVDVFDAQDAAYRESVLPAAVTRRVVVEAGRDRALVQVRRFAGHRDRHRLLRRVRVRRKSFSSISASPPNGWPPPWRRCSKCSTLNIAADFLDSRSTI